MEIRLYKIVDYLSIIKMEQSGTHFDYCCTFKQYQSPSLSYVGIEEVKLFFKTLKFLAKQTSE